MNYKNTSRIYVTNQRIYFEFFFPKFKILEFPVKKYNGYKEITFSLFSVILGKGICIFYKDNSNKLKRVQINIKKSKAEILKNLLNKIKN